MANFYCEYCGAKFSNASSLLSQSCSRYPSGFHKGKHKLYEGSEKNKYLCKYCGASFNSLSSLTSQTCSKHPNGFHKGKHAPTL
mgnify:CR=1 FL=1